MTDGKPHPILKNYREVTRYPYFQEGRDGEPCLRPELKKRIRVIDMHAHLAWTYFFSKPIQLFARSTAVHFLTMPDQRVSINRYFYRDMTPRDALRFYRNTIASLWRSPQENTYHTIPNLIDDMNRMGISRTVVLPIDLPFSRNSEILLKSTRGNSRIIPFCSLHPAMGHKERRLKAFVRWGARGFKFHPVAMASPPDSTEAMKLFEVCAAIKLPVLTHTSSTGIELGYMQSCSKVKNFEEPVRAFPEIPFVLGHAGFREIDEIIRYCNEYPNAYLEISGQPLSNIEKIIRETPDHKIMFGSDWSWYHPAVPLLTVLIATEGDEELRDKFLYRNAARVLGED
ncbi:MAG: amidohydrolase family protein [bacterium]